MAPFHINDVAPPKLKALASRELLLPQSAGCRGVSGTARVILREEEVMKLIIAFCSHTHQSKVQLLLRTASDVSRSVTICTWILYKLVEQLESSLAY